MGSVEDHGDKLCFCDQLGLDFQEEQPESGFWQTYESTDS